MIKKRKHHYVWEHYLKAWATHDQVWCQRGDRRFRTNTEKVANRRDFYRLKEMSRSDIEFVEALIERMEPNLRELARGWIPHFTVFFELQKAYQASGKQSAEFEKELDLEINNLEEDLHMHVEKAANPILTALRQRDTTVLDDPDRFVDFSWFIAMQYLRTPRIMDGVLRATSGLSNFNIEAAWGLLRTIFATNMGAMLFARHASLRLTFLDAPSDAEFITGDQPIINLRAVGLIGMKPATELEFYYPLTPSLALLMDFDHPQARSERRTLSAEEVRNYNLKLMTMSDGQVYAASEKELDVLRSS